jgi:hypothetical protein
MQKIRVIGFFLKNRIHWQFEVGKKISTNGCSRLYIYLHKNKTLIRNFFRVFDKWGKNLNHEKISKIRVRKCLTFWHRSFTFKF